MRYADGIRCVARAELELQLRGDLVGIVEIGSVIGAALGELRAQIAGPELAEQADVIRGIGRCIGHDRRLVAGPCRVHILIQLLGVEQHAENEIVRPVEG
jgi:hypothetical protein